MNDALSISLSLFLFALPLIHSMDKSYQVSTMVHGGARYCIESLLYGNKTNIAGTIAVTVATFKATYKTALILQTLLLAKHMITFHFFLRNPSSCFYLKTAEVTGLCANYSFYLLVAHIGYLGLSNSKAVHAANNFADLLRSRKTTIDLETGKIIEVKTDSVLKSIFWL